MEEIVAEGKHQVTVFSRRVGRKNTSWPRSPWCLTAHLQDVQGVAKPGLKLVQIKDYSDKAELVAALRGVHTVLSFVTQDDPENTAQKTLIDASVEAGVKRFAPSEWAL